jgi:hypothetical protein
MAIDTATKRKSAINAGLPSLALMPVPDGSIGALDRRHLADLYSLVSQSIGQNFWMPDRRDTFMNWGQDVRMTQHTWVPENDADTSWKEEAEVS